MRVTNHNTAWNGSTGWMEEAACRTNRAQRSSPLSATSRSAIEYRNELKSSATPVPAQLGGWSSRWSIALLMACGVEPAKKNVEQLAGKDGGWYQDQLVPMTAGD